MTIAPSARIHPTAVISSEANIGANVQIGPYVVLDGSVTIGPDCIIRAHSHLVGDLTMGCSNDVGTGSVLGDRPQHLQFKNQATRLEIGDFNVFREHVTIHRGSHVTGVTKVGNHNYFMVNTHIAHDCTVGNHVILANGALVAGHCELGDRIFMSGNCAIHQFTRMGRLSLISGCSTSTKDILPFLMVEGRDNVVGVNLVGLRRAGIPPEQVMAIKEAYQILYRQGMMLKVAKAKLERELGSVPAVAEMLEFLRKSKRGIIGGEADSSDSHDIAA